MGLWSKLTLPIAIFIIVIFAGAFVYQNLEKWRYLDSLYFTVITVATIGYGDFTPKTDAGKIFTIFFSFFGVGMGLYFISLIGKYIFKKQLRQKLRETGRIKHHRGIHKIK